MTTRFDPASEAAFRADYAARSLTSVRFGLVLGACLYALFAPLDIWMLPETWRFAHLIRFGVVVPVCLASLVPTFVTRGREHLQVLVSVFVVVAGLGIVSMIAVSREGEAGFRYYYAGLLLVLMYSFTVVRLRFIPTAVCCLVIIAAYEIAAISSQNLLSEGLLKGRGPVFLNNNFFLVSGGVITLIGSYILEDYSRKDFHQRNELAKTLDELKATQTHLIQSERTTAMSSVVAGLLHELNTPVGVIASAADVVNRGAQKLEELDHDARPEAPDPRAQARNKTTALIEDSAKVLRDAASRVTQALDVLKRFSHLDKSETAEYEVNASLEDCLTLLAHEAGERVVVERQFGNLPKIRCRPAEINQLFMSLLKNAVEAIPEAGTIEVRTSSLNGNVVIDITDSGVGIPEEQLKDVFVPKFSRDTSRVKLGLGLVTAHNIVHRHGGSIAIESWVGKGTHVCITLPERTMGDTP